jgi:hypothetical protein
VVVGESTAGKTRAAFEAIRTVLPRHTFIRPVDRSAVRAAIRAARRFRPAVVWLDDLEQYLGGDGLTASQMTEVLNAGQRVLVLATMRAQEHGRYSPRADATGNSSGGPVVRQGRAVLDLATEIRLERRWTETELTRAEVHRGDPRIADALRFTDRYGLAEYLAAGPQLLADWRDAWAPGAHPRGAALVSAAVDVRRAGYHRPLTTAVLRRLHEDYLNERGRPVLQPEPWDSALAWAQQPTHATSSLLAPQGVDRYLAFDYLPDAVDAEEVPALVPEPVWATVVGLADPVTASDIGWTAYARGYWDAAEAAFQRALDGGELLASVGLANVFGHVRLQSADAVSVLRSTLAGIDATSASHRGLDPGDLLILRGELAWFLGGADQAPEALALIRQVAADAADTFGTDDRRTLDTRIQLARWTGETGNPGDALRLARQVSADYLRLFGPDDYMTLSSRFEVAIWTGHAGNSRGAADLLAALLPDNVRVAGAEERITLDIRRNLAHWLARAGDIDSALVLRTDLVADVAEIYGMQHPVTLSDRIELAWLMADIGQREEGLQLTEAITIDATAALGPDHPVTLQALTQLTELRHNDRDTPDEPSPNRPLT